MELNFKANKKTQTNNATYIIQGESVITCSFWTNLMKYSPFVPRSKMLV